MTWNYRIMKREINPGEHEFGIYEVYYDEAGNIISCSKESMVPTCGSEEAILQEIEIMKKAFDKETLLYVGD